jgi:hypothetical protein
VANKVFTANGVPTNGTQITTANQGTSGDVIAIVKSSSGSVIGTATDGEIIRGSASVKLSAGSGQYAYLSWPETGLTAVGFRAYFRLSSTATSYSLMSVSNGNAQMAKVILLNNGHVYLTDSNGTVTYQTPEALTFPGVYAIDIAVQAGTSSSNGMMKLAVYGIDDDLTAGMSQAFESGTANTGTTTVASLNVGKIESTAVAATIIVDDVKRTDTYTLVGPEPTAASAAVITPGNQAGLTAGQVRTLSASSSTGNPTLYQWRQVSGPPVTLSSTTASSTSYVVPAVSTDSEVQIQLRVATNGVYSSPAFITDTVIQHSVWFMKEGSLLPGTFQRQALPETTVTATNITATSITLNWTAVAGATGFLVGRSGVDSNGNGAYQTTDSSSTRSRVFINLLPETSYTIYCEPQPNGVRKSLTITTAAAPVQTTSWDWSETNQPWAFTDTSVFTADWPQGTSIVDLQTGSGSFYDRLRATVIAANKRVVVRLPAGKHSYTSFRMIGSSGIPTYAFGFWHPNLQGFLGQGPEQTIIQMEPNSVSETQLNYMKTMEAGPSGQPNQMGFMRLDGSASSPILVAGVTFRGTDQPMLTDGTDSVKSYGATFPQSAPYTGIVMYSTSPGIISYTRFQAAARALTALPPFEHCNMGSQYSPSMMVHHCEMDGRLAAEVDPSRPRRCGSIMANNETLHQISDSWLHDVHLTRYAANDQNRDTFGTYNVIRTKMSLGNKSSAGWESCAATINLTDCIFQIDTPEPSAELGYTYHVELTPVGGRSNPRGGRLNVTRGTFKSAKYPSMDGFLTVRAIGSMYWVTDGYATTMKVIDSNGQRKQPYVVTNWPASTATLSGAGVTPATHFLVRNN